MMRIDNSEGGDQVLAYFCDRSGQEIPVAEAVHSLAGDDATTARRVRKRVCRLCEQGHLVRVRTGVYRATARPAVGAGQSKYEVMWRLLRARRSVTVDDLQELAGVSREYAQRFCAAMVRHDAARRIAPGHYQLSADTVRMPRDKKRAAENKRRAMAAIDNAKQALDAAEVAIRDMED